MLATVTNKGLAARGFATLDRGIVMLEAGASTMLDLADHLTHRAWAAAGEVLIAPLGDREARAARTMSKAGCSALINCICVRWTMTSSTVRSPRSSKPPNMLRSSRSTPPSRCSRSTVLLSSSWPDRIERRSLSDTPKTMRMPWTVTSTALRTGPNTDTTRAAAGAKNSETRSG